MTGSAADAWEQASLLVEQGVQVEVEADLPLSYLTWRPQGQFGDDTIREKRIDDVEIAQASADFVDNVDKPQFRARDLNNFYLNRTLEFGWKDTNQIIKMGGMSASDMKLIEALYFGAIKGLFQGTTAEANGVAVEGFTAAGSGTYASPSILDASTSAGAWDVAGNAIKDLNKMIEKLIDANARRPYVLSYPRRAVGAFMYCMNSAEPQAGNIMQYARSAGMFDYVIATGNDYNDYNLISGAAETSEDMQIYAWSMPDMVVKYQIPLGTKTIPWDQKKMLGWIRAEGNMQAAPIPRKTGTSTYQKMICEIDSIDLTT